MAAGPWTIYNAAKRLLMDGSIDLDTDSYKLSLFTSASNATNLSLSTLGSVSNEATGLNYVPQPLTVALGQGASAGQQRFNAANVVFDGPITNMKFAVIWKVGVSAGAQKLLCVTQLSAAAFSLSNIQNHSIVPSANGIFELK
jgi:hypothetical protein